jgi:hypothetical protein
MKLNRNSTPATIRAIRSTPSEYQAELDAIQERQGQVRYALGLLSLLVAVVIVSAVLG